MTRRDAFLQFVVDQLRGLEDLRTRSMFGGHGLYCGDSFFGIVFGGRLYFKTNRETRTKYTEAGMGYFSPRPEQALKNYREVPVDVIENDDKLVAWAREAVQLGNMTT